MYPLFKMTKTQNPNTVYAVIDAADVALIDIDQIGESAISTILHNLAQDQAMIKWQLGQVPRVIGNGQVIPIQILDHESMVGLIHSPLWSEPIIDQP